MIKKLAALFVLAWCACAQGAASTDASDLWWNPSESGWGVNVAHQGNLLFMTLFVYSPSGQPTWYVASSMQSSDGSTFTGLLYQTTGPWFGATFDSAQVGVRQVGAATFSYRSADEATLAYSVDAVSVAKTITRQTFSRNDLSGFYMGGFVGTYVNCGLREYSEQPSDLTITHTGANISIEAIFREETCTYTGTYSQAGRLGRIVGRVDCGNGDIGEFTASEIESSRNGITASATAEYRSCRWSGRLGGIRFGAEP